MKRNFLNVAIYGMGRLGDMLYVLLQNSSFRVQYVIDKKADSFIYDVPVFLPNDADLKTKTQDVDAVIVTPVVDRDAIKEELHALGFRNIFLIREMVNEL